MPHALASDVEDPRGLLQRLRRNELEAILAAEGVDYPKDIPAFSARVLIVSHGISPEKYIVNGHFVKPKPKVKTLEEMTMAEVRSKCTEEGVEWSRSSKKDDLIEKLRNA